MYPVIKSAEIITRACFLTIFRHFEVRDVLYLICL